MNIPRQITDYEALLRQPEPWTLCNIGGDGELLTIVGWGGTNSDGKESTPEKAEALARCITEPRYTFAGYNPGRLETQKLADAEGWLRRNGVNVPNRDKGFRDPEYGTTDVTVRWVHKEIISSANCRGKLGGLLSTLRERRPFVVGADWLTEDFLAGVLDARGSFLVPPEVGWESLDALEKGVREAFADLPENAVVTWGLGYLTKVLMWRLIPDFPRLTQIDVGACWDPYCGHRNRKGYRADTWPAAMRANLAPHAHPED